MMGTLDEFEKKRFMNMIRDSIITLCRNGIIMSTIASVEGLLGITLENNEVFLVNIKEELASIQRSQNSVQKRPASPKRIGQGARAKRRRSQDSIGSLHAQAVSIDSTDSDFGNAEAWNMNRAGDRTQDSLDVTCDDVQDKSYDCTIPADVHVTPVSESKNDHTQRHDDQHMPTVARQSDTVAHAPENTDKLVQIKTEPVDLGEGTSQEMPVSGMSFKLYSLKEMYSAESAFVQHHQPIQPQYVPGGKHYLEKIRVQAPFKHRRQRRCRVCYKNGQRRDVTTVCYSCPNEPGLCVEPCFQIWHEKHSLPY